MLIILLTKKKVQVLFFVVKALFMYVHKALFLFLSLYVIVMETNFNNKKTVHEKFQF